jgi:origin recognition complex subunit 2
MKFADHIYQAQNDHTKAKIVVVNGYVHNLTLKDILNTIAVSITERGYKLGSQPADMLDNLLALLEKDKAHDITLIIHSIDRVPLRRQTTQTLLSRLASHPQVHLITSADHPSFPLLWDSSLRSTYNFVFHDCTTFQPYTAEIDVVDEVHELLGRSGRRVGGKEGVSFVLKSLPENAKNLFRVLIGEQLAAMDDSGGALEGVDDDDDDHDERRVLGHKKNEAGVEYRVLYNKAVEEFICSNEMNFRTLLKE